MEGVWFTIAYLSLKERKARVLQGVRFDGKGRAAAGIVTNAGPMPVGPDDSLHAFVMPAFDTTCRFYARTDDASLFDTMRARCEEYDRLLSHTRPDSSLSFLNAACGMPARVNPRLAGLIARALDYCSATDGLLDITAGSLEALWNYHRAQKPTDAEVESALRHVGYRHVQVNGDVVTVGDPAVKIVLGAVAKGFIADGLCDLMRDAGVESGVVDLGGNLAVVGSMPNGAPWRFEVADPACGDRPKAIIECRDESAVTSGTYERNFTEDGHLYHHIVDPRTGYPAESDIVGVTVVANSSLDADAYATALLIMGSVRALAFVADLPGVEAFIIRSDGEVLLSGGMTPRVTYLS